jgi:hypothetical protein
VCVKDFAEGFEMERKAHIETDRVLDDMIRGPVSGLNRPGFAEAPTLEKMEP